MSYLRAKQGRGHRPKIPVYAILFALAYSGCIDEPVEYPAYNGSKNYCGPEGKLSVPRSHLLSGADFNMACYEHDKCYELCGKTGNSQRYCDLKFKKIMDDACDDEFDRRMRECERRGKYNPLRYTCIASARFRATTCWAQAESYYQSVSALGKAIGSYPCENDQ